ncbi:enoyl-CoA hydratase/isomerase family protein [Actinospica sp.]|uniref:enoyl-CoA hydratase/isomerase family protein n=1 Tax=Actinospica sp. TaxID=1872142 RepID=UPI002C37EBEF|nr:enoyl-CoA hydratase-related protein [Actinospica sp.]HWG23110.1 enoyl-CoA hydratase-related protein [Actinospica sp.]
MTADSARTEPVVYTVDGAVATIAFNRPDAMNALNVATKDALLDALREASGDPKVRAVVLTGTGRAFCVGQDLREHMTKVMAGDEEGISGTVRKHYNPITLLLTGMPKPVIAAVNGVAAGAGAGFMLACDFRVAVDTAGVNMAFAGVALSADSGASWTLPRVVGQAKAVELLLQPETIPAARALELGLFTELVPADKFAERVRELAEKLAAGPTVSYASIKESIAYGSTHTLAETLEKEDEMQRRCFLAADHLEAVNAFLEKRQPDFTGQRADG